MRVLSLAAVGILSLFRLAASQDLSSLPQCAQSCALTAIGSTGCAVTDAACICKSSGFLSGVATCITTACSAADQQATYQFAQQYCLSGGVTITVPGASSSAPAPTPAGSPSPTPAPAPASTTSSSAPASSAAPVATYSGSAQSLKQQWAGVAGVVGLGLAVVL